MLPTLLNCVVFLNFIQTALSQNYIVENLVETNLMKCYECNVWKAGYGQLCNNPRIRSGCYACMKVETIIFMGYYKNTPRYSTVISRACANSKSVPFHHECQYFDMGDGHSRRCYCNTPLCNHAQLISSAMLWNYGIIVLIVLTLFWLHHRDNYWSHTSGTFVKLFLLDHSAYVFAILIFIIFIYNKSSENSISIDRVICSLEVKHRRS